jgi:hypothetical protein
MTAEVATRTARALGRCRRRRAAAALALASLAGCTAAPVPVPPGAAGPDPPRPQLACTAEANDAEAMHRVLAAARPGNRICLRADTGSARLTLTRSGTPEEPIVVLGGGRAVTGGITVEADNVVVDGVIARDPDAPGMSLRGTNITVTNSVVASPRGGDGDGIRFWGRDIRIAHNTISDTRGQDERHADCMQTFATDEQHPASQDVLIEANRCERIDNICLIAEGPNSEAGDGSGQGRSRNLVFRDNYCDNRAGQAVFVDDVSDVAVVGNRIVGPVSKAFAFQNGATGALVRDNELAPEIDYEVGIDDSSQDGYDGPEPGGAP